jgi:hypothetical protein
LLYFRSGTENKSELLARFISLEKLEKLILLEIEALKNIDKKAVSVPLVSSPKHTITWTSPNKTDAIEIAYALQKMGVFNHGKAQITEIVEVIEDSFNISLPNPHQFIRNIKKRKKERAFFIESMKSAINSDIS